MIGVSWVPTPFFLSESPSGNVRFLGMQLAWGAQGLGKAKTEVWFPTAGLVTLTEIVFIWIMGEPKAL
jgi:hypothetical protein